jgi:hypothetical protein
MILKTGSKNRERIEAICALLCGSIETHMESLQLSIVGLLFDLDTKGGKFGVTILHVSILTFVQEISDLNPHSPFIPRNSSHIVCPV